MATVLIPIPRNDCDPTAVAVSWKVLKRIGRSVVFATPPAVKRGRHHADGRGPRPLGLPARIATPWSGSAGWRGRMRTHGGPMRRCGSIRRSRPACLAAVGCRRLRRPVAPPAAIVREVRLEYLKAMSCRGWS